MNGYIPDNCINRGGAAPKPWVNNEGWTEAMEKFHADRNNWLTTWVGDEATMKVDYVRVYKPTSEGNSEISFHFLHCNL